MLIQRPASPADIPVLWTIRTQALRVTCASHYDASVIEAMCAAPPPASLPGLVGAGGAVVVEQHGQALGYAILNVRSGEIDALFVDPDHQRRGIALQLLQAVEAIAAQHHLTRLFLSSSLNAVRLYQRAGFTALREEAYPHRSGIAIPSVFMEKHLGSQAAGQLSARIS